MSVLPKGSSHTCLEHPIVIFFILGKEIAKSYARLSSSDSPEIRSCSMNEYWDAFNRMCFFTRVVPHFILLCKSTEITSGFQYICFANKVKPDFFPHQSRDWSSFYFISSLDDGGDWGTCSHWTFIRGNK